jgi:hypothetical protein
VSATPPEPGFSWSGNQSPAPIAAPRKLSVYRILCGISWAAVAAIMLAGGIAELTISNVGGAVLCFVVAVGAGWYDYRIWTFKARRLWIFL